MRISDWSSDVCSSDLARSGEIMRNRGRLSLYGCGSAALALWLAAAPVAAAQSVRSFDIPAGDLGRALNSFARQANQELIFSSALVAGKRTKGVRGGLEPRAALDILLEGSGLRGEGGSVLTLRPRSEEHTSELQ